MQFIARVVERSAALDNRCGWRGRAVSEAQPRSHRVLIGATVGAIGGGVLGFLAGSSIIVGCKAIYPSDCNPGREERRLRINGAIIGATLGAGIGALVGRLWH